MRISLLIAVVLSAWLGFSGVNSPRMSDAGFNPESFLGIKFGEKIPGGHAVAQIPASKYRCFNETASVYADENGRIETIQLEANMDGVPREAAIKELAATCQDLSARYGIDFVDGYDTYTFENRYFVLELVCLPADHTIQMTMTRKRERVPRHPKL